MRRCVLRMRISTFKPRAASGVGVGDVTKHPLAVTYCVLHILYIIHMAMANYYYGDQGQYKA